MEDSGSGRRRSASLSAMTPPPAASSRPQIPAHERADPTAFVQARAHLAATLNGASVGELGHEVEKALQRVNTWQSTQARPLSPMVGQQIRQTTLQRDYVAVYRFQDERGHDKPRREQELSAMQQIRAMHGGEYHGPGTTALVNTHLATAIAAAEHTKGFNDSAFVSLLGEPERLTHSSDDGKKGAKSIALGARQLHTYTVPRVAAWTPQRMLDVLAAPSDAQGVWKDEQIQGGNGEQTYAEWLNSTPTHETEVLFHGGDLGKYRTKEEVNPYLPKRRKR